MASNPRTEPVLLLKTRSGPNDAYLELFSRPQGSRHYAPRFVPVLRHHFRDAELSRVRRLLRENKISQDKGAEYGGMIFTSQRAVEAFASLVEEGSLANEDSTWPHLSSVPFYSVGPATTRALSNIPSTPALSIHGSHTGTGEILAPFILDHYAALYPHRTPKPPVLFLVGETRRDIIPKTLMAPDLPLERRIQVTEEIVYGTGVMQSFPSDFSQILEETKESERRWVVVFSPTGCDGMLEGLGMLDGNGKFDSTKRDGKTLIITIGPTTQRFLREEFGFEPDASAKAPSPEGVLAAILDYNATSS